VHVKAGETYVLTDWKKPVFFVVLEDDELVVLFFDGEPARLWRIRDDSHPQLGFSMERAAFSCMWEKFE